jgi:hypothetical protein
MALTRPTQSQIRDVTSAINVVSAQANLTVSLIDAVSAVSNSFSYIKTLRFDSDAGFDVNDLGGGAVKIGMNSTFKTWKVAGQTDLVATGLDTIELVASNGIVLTTNPSGSPYKTLTFAAEVTSAQVASIDTKLSNAISTVSAAAASVESHVNTVSNAVSVVSAQVVSVSAVLQNAISNEVSNRQSASAALESHINTVSNAVSVVSAAIASVESHVNTVSNAVSVVSAAQLSSWNAISNEISVRGAASADLKSAINIVSAAVNTVSNTLSVETAARISADISLSTRIDAVAQSLNIHAAVKAATTGNLATLTGGSVTYNSGNSTISLGTALTLTEFWLKMNPIRPGTVSIPGQLVEYY